MNQPILSGLRSRQRLTVTARLDGKTHQLSEPTTDVDRRVAPRHIYLRWAAVVAAASLVLSPRLFAADVPGLPADAKYSNPKMQRYIDWKRGFLKLVDDVTAKLEGIRKRADAFDVFTTALTAKTLTDESAIRNARESLFQYETLMDDQDAIVAHYLAQAEAYLRAGDTDGREHPVALATFLAEEKRVMKVYSNVTSATRRSIASAIAVLNFAERSQIHMTAQDGELLFDDEETLHECERLTERVADATKVASEAMSALQAFQAENQRTMQRLAKELDKQVANLKRPL